MSIAHSGVLCPTFGADFCRVRTRAGGENRRPCAAARFGVEFKDSSGRSVDGVLVLHPILVKFDLIHLNAVVVLKLRLGEIHLAGRQARMRKRDLFGALQADIRAVVARLRFALGFFLAHRAGRSVDFIFVLHRCGVEIDVIHKHAVLAVALLLGERRVCRTHACVRQRRVLRSLQPDVGFLLHGRACLRRARFGYARLRCARFGCTHIRSGVRFLRNGRARIAGIQTGRHRVRIPLLHLGAPREHRAVRSLDDVFPFDAVGREFDLVNKAPFFKIKIRVSEIRVRTADACVQQRLFLRGRRADGIAFRDAFRGERGRRSGGGEDGQHAYARYDRPLRRCK